MTVPTLGPGHTREDYYALPDDGPRHELVEGELVMAASPSWDHQRVVKQMVRVLDDACPGGLGVLPAPFDVDLEDNTIVKPDVLVFDRDRAEQHAVIGAP